MVKIKGIDSVVIKSMFNGVVGDKLSLRFDEYKKDTLGKSVLLNGNILHSAEDLLCVEFVDNNLIVIFHKGYEITDCMDLFSDKHTLNNVDFSGITISEKNKDCSFMFSSSGIETVNFGNYRFSNVKSMAGMFSVCPNLKNIIVKDIDTSKVDNMRVMFYKNTSLGDGGKEFISKLNTSNVKTMESMFYGCLGFTELDLSNFRTDKVSNYKYLFDGCENLQRLNISNFKFKDNLRFNILSQAFAKCRALEYVNLGEMFSNLANSNIASARFLSSAPVEFRTYNNGIWEK